MQRTKGSGKAEDAEAGPSSAAEPVAGASAAVPAEGVPDDGQLAQATKDVLDGLETLGDFNLKQLLEALGAHTRTPLLPLLLVSTSWLRGCTVGQAVAAVAVLTPQHCRPREALQACEPGTPVPAESGHAGLSWPRWCRQAVPSAELGHHGGQAQARQGDRHRAHGRDAGGRRRGHG